MITDDITPIVRAPTNVELFVFDADKDLEDCYFLGWEDETKECCLLRPVAEGHGEYTLTFHRSSVLGLPPDNQDRYIKTKLVDIITAYRESNGLNPSKIQVGSLFMNLVCARSMWLDSDCPKMIFGIPLEILEGQDRMEPWRLFK